MTDLERFEAWLVLQMLPGPEADAALSSLAGSRERAEFGAREFAARTGIERPGCPAATYRVILGAPRRSTPLPLSAMSERFAGSVADDYFLPIWHRHLFRVCRHPEGWAWGERFVTSRGHGRCSCSSESAATR
jgi:hypothetical protein